jgi:hypothetical protein
LSRYVPATEHDVCAAVQLPYCDITCPPEHDVGCAVPPVQRRPDGQTRQKGLASVTLSR